uniref:BED-type domain-containing protein n=1 Tax=Meloidogyne hapla TaxID=6305 RepID=A0A1I8B7S7_MELHA
MPKPSAIWEINLFKKLNVDQAECKQCKEDGRETIIIPRKGGNTKGLITHLENSHKDSSYHKKYIELTTENTQCQRTLDDFTKAGNVLGGGGLSGADKRIINFICCNLISFAALNNPATKAVFKDLVKDESFYRKEVLASAYKLIKLKSYISFHHRKMGIEIICFVDFYYWMY